MNDPRPDDERRSCHDRGSADDHRFIVDDDGQRLDRFLADRLPELSRSALKKLIKDGRIRGPRALKPASRLSQGEEIVVALPPPPPPPAPLSAEDIPLSILYQDAELLLIDKPPGLTVHPGAGQRDGTLANALLNFGGAFSSLGGDERPGIVHRLDKDTSGVMVIARSDAAHRHLSAQFKARTTAKSYRAIVRGAPPERGTIDRPIGRNLRDRKRMAIRIDTGRRAVSHFEVLERFGRAAALVAVRIETGRTHQIRVHLSSLGHGVLGDETYGRKGAFEEVIGRQALHAFSLEIDHPTSGERLRGEAPLPADFEAAITRLRAESRGGC